MTGAPLLQLQYVEDVDYLLSIYYFPHDVNCRGCPRPTRLTLLRLGWK